MHPSAKNVFKVYSIFVRFLYVVYGSARKRIALLHKLFNNYYYSIDMYT